MPGRIEPLTETGIIADMRAELARLRRGFTAAQSPIWEYQDWVLTGTPPTSTYTLTYVPYGINHVSMNGLTAREGTDYTMDYSTGILTYTASKTAGDVLSISYVTTGDLVAASGAVDTGNLLTETEATFETGLSTDWQQVSGTNPTTLTRVSSTSHSGTYSLEVVSTSGDSIPLQAILARHPAVTGGGTYTLSGWVKPSRVTQPILRVHGLDAGGSLIDVFSATTGGITVGTWGQVTNSSFTFSSTVVTARLVLLSQNSGACIAGETMDWDDLFFGTA